MKKGEIWLVELPSSNGYEQSGTRPVIVFTEPKVNIVIIIPLTSNTQALQYPHTIEVKPKTKNGLKETSVGLVFQIRAIDKKRLKNKIGELNKSTIKEINSMLKSLLSL